MKKNIVCYAFMSMLAFSSCYYAQEEFLVTNESEVDFRLSYEGITQSSMATRAANAPTLTVPENLIVFDVFGAGTNGEATKVYSFTSLSSVQLPLAYGKHDLYFVAAAKKDGASFDKDALQMTWPNDGSLGAVWGYRYQIVVGADTRFEDILLPLVVADVRLATLDNMPSTIQTVKIEAPDICPVLDLKTMVGQPGDTGYNRTLDVSSTAGNGTTFAANIYTFVPESQSVGDVRIAFYTDAEGTTEKSSREVQNVPVKMGYVSNYTGYFFSDGISIPLSTTTDWLGVNDYTF